MTLQWIWSSMKSASGSREKLRSLLVKRITHSLPNRTEATHILAASLFVISILLALNQYLHFVSRRSLQLAATPGKFLHCVLSHIFFLILVVSLGSLASALAFTAGTNANHTLSPRDDDAEIQRKLQNHLYGIDAETGKLVAT